MSGVFLSSTMVLTLVSASFVSIIQDQSQQTQPQAPSTQSGAGQSTANANPRQSQRGGQRGIDLSDRRFVIEASESSEAELAHSQLALQRATSEDVKQFAQRVIDDHKKANQELTRLAMNKGVPIPPDQATPLPLMGKHRDVNDRLANLSGDEFDREYMRNQVKMHEETIFLFERQIKKGKDTELKSFAIHSLPALRERQRATRDLATKIGVTKKPGAKTVNSPGQPSNAGSTSPPRQ